jgi:hypothetical protein
MRLKFFLYFHCILIFILFKLWSLSLMIKPLHEYNEFLQGRKCLTMMSAVKKHGQYPLKI